METVHPLVAHVSSTALPGALDSIVQPDTITPQQWNDQWHKPAEPSPELRLWWAVLEDAIRLFKAPPRASRQPLHGEDGHCASKCHQCNAERWFASTSTSLCSFLWVCEILGQDPETIRKGLAIMPPTKRIGRRRPNVRYQQLADTARRHE